MEEKYRGRVYVLGQLGGGILSLFGERSLPPPADFKISTLHVERAQFTVARVHLRNQRR